MTWAVPQYSREEINKAGKALLGPTGADSCTEEQLEIINNWRSSHNFPLNTFQIGLRAKARQVDTRALIAQRIKRLSSIELKLKRFEKMKLSQMQDIGGCRAVVSSVVKVRQLERLYKRSRVKHSLIHADNYIESPQPSGYRGIHLIYRFQSDHSYSRVYNDLKIEIQLRSQLQHSWATAVETVGTFTKQALKSSQGEKEWLRFFALMGTAIAFRERTAAIPATPVDKAELGREIKEYARRLKVIERLETYQSAVGIVNERVSGAHYYLLHLDAANHRVTVLGYKNTELEEASRAYLALEKSIADVQGSDAVLVSVQSLNALRRAYPNYFLDTRYFIVSVKRALAEL